MISEQARYWVWPALILRNNDFVDVSKLRISLLFLE